MKKQLLFNFRMAAFAALTLLTAQSSFAQSPFTWTGGTSTDFLTSSNWTSTNLSQPTFIAADAFIIPSSGVTNFPILNTTPTTAASITMQAGTTLTTNAAVTLTGLLSVGATGTTAILETNADFTLNSSSASTINGTVNINSGTFTGRVYVGTAALAKVNIATAGTLIATGTSHIGNNFSVTHEVNVNGGNFSVPAGATLNIGSSSSRKGALNLNSGGVQISGAISPTTSVPSGTVYTPNAFINVAGGIFDYNSANMNVNLGEINITGGLFNLNNPTATINANSTSVGTSILGLINIKGGTLDAKGALTIGSTTSTSVVTVNVTSGTMKVAGALSVLPTATVNVGLGSIVLTGNQKTAIDALVAAGRIAPATGRLFDATAVSFDGTNTIVTSIDDPNLGLNDVAADANDVVVYAQDKNIKIQSGNGILSEVTVYDLTGRLVASKKSIGSNETSIALNASKAVYVVKVTTADGNVVTKKIVQ